MLGIGVIAVRGRKIRLKLRLKIGGIQGREQLSGMHRVAFPNVHGVRGFRERALNRDVLVGGNDAGELARGVNRSEPDDRALDDRHLGTRRRVPRAPRGG